MYRIQAYNAKLGRIIVTIVGTMVERDSTMKALKANPDYGLVTFEYNPRGSFYR